MFRESDDGGSSDEPEYIGPFGSHIVAEEIAKLLASRYLGGSAPEPNCVEVLEFIVDESEERAYKAARDEMLWNGRPVARLTESDSSE
jgi:hypothetical protein